MAAKKKRSGGRPRLPESKRRKSVVAVRFTRAERGRIAKAAQSEGLTPGVWLRRLALLSLGLESE